MPFIPLTNNQENQKQADADLLEYAKAVFLEMLGESGQRIDPLFLKNRTLTVTCGNLEIATELREKMEEIVAKINEKIGKQEVDRIRYLL